MVQIQILLGLNRVREGVPEGELVCERRVFMRYRGQGWDIPVSLTGEPFGADGESRLEALFEGAYREFFGRTISGLAIEAVSWSVRVSSPVTPGAKVEITKALGEAAPVGERSVFDAVSGRFERAAVVEREEMKVGDRVLGPAVIVESQTTTYVPPDLQAVRQVDGCLLLERKGEPA